RERGPGARARLHGTVHGAAEPALEVALARDLERLGTAPHLADLALEAVALAALERLRVEVVHVGGAGGHAPRDVVVAADTDERQARRDHAARVEPGPVHLELGELLGNLETQ